MESPDISSFNTPPLSPSFILAPSIVRRGYIPLWSWSFLLLAPVTLPPALPPLESLNLTPPTEYSAEAPSASSQLSAFFAYEALRPSFLFMSTRIREPASDEAAAAVILSESAQYCGILTPLRAIRAVVNAASFLCFIMTSSLADSERFKPITNISHIQTSINSILHSKTCIFSTMIKARKKHLPL